MDGPYGQGQALHRRGEDTATATDGERKRAGQGKAGQPYGSASKRSAEIGLPEARSHIIHTVGEAGSVAPNTMLHVALFFFLLHVSASV